MTPAEAAGTVDITVTTPAARAPPARLTSSTSPPFRRSPASARSQDHSRAAPRSRSPAATSPAPRSLVRDHGRQACSPSTRPPRSRSTPRPRPPAPSMSQWSRPPARAPRAPPSMFIYEASTHRQCHRPDTRLHDRGTSVTITGTNFPPLPLSARREQPRPAARSSPPPR